MSRQQQQQENSYFDNRPTLVELEENVEGEDIHDINEGTLEFREDPIDRRVAGKKPQNKWTVWMKRGFIAVCVVAAIIIGIIVLRSLFAKNKNPNPDPVLDSKYTAFCRLVGTPASTNPGLTGTVQLTQASADVPTTVELKVIGGLAPNSTHGFHIHTFGDMSKPDATSTGGHYAPNSTMMHSLPSDTEHNYHTGDMGNIVADAEGKIAYWTGGFSKIKLYGDNSVIGRAIIIHSGADKGYDFQPAGDAGSRIAWCIIGVGKTPLAATQAANNSLAVSKAIAFLYTLDNTKDPIGQVLFTQEESGAVRVDASFSSMPANTTIQSFDIMSSGDLSENAQYIGTSIKSFGSLTNNAAGYACFSQTFTDISMSSILGHGIVINTTTTNNNNNGEKVGYGVIGIANPDYPGSPDTSNC